MVALNPAGYPGGMEREVPPPQVALMAVHALKIGRNERGCWEAQMKYGIRLVYIPPGSFDMGSPAGEPGREDDEGPVRRIHLDGYWIGKYEVTGATWKAIRHHTPSAVRTGGDDFPVSNVSWDEAQAFIKGLNRVSGVTYRLPTEAEWERACRAGTSGPTCGTLEDIAWYSANAEGTLHPVGGRIPNAYGLHDVLGNVWEYCSDWYQASYYRQGPSLNPRGPSSGTRRSIRGGGYQHKRSYCRSAHRNSIPPDQRRPHTGFRLCI